MDEGIGREGRKQMSEICLFVSSEVVPIIASKRAAVLGNICFGVKGGLACAGEKEGDDNQTKNRSTCEQLLAQIAF